MKPVVVQKYGGSSVATTERIREVASLIKRRREEGFRLCVVVSAMGKTTDELLRLAKEISQNPSRRELDMLLSCGERASMALLAMALLEIQVPSISFTGSQSGIITDSVHSGAQIVEVRPERVLAELEQDKVVIVAGFQGVSRQREITTLGRGGSDTTAVALAAALNAEACEIYSDVAGVYTADPRVVPDAQIMDVVDFDTMLELSNAGAKVLNYQAVAFAKHKNIQIYARKTGDTSSQTLITSKVATQRIAVACRERVYSVQVKDEGELCRNLAALQNQPHVDVVGSWPVLVSVAPEDAHHLESLGFNRDLGTVTVLTSSPRELPILLRRSLELFSRQQIMPKWVLSTFSKCTFWLPCDQIHESVKLLHSLIQELEQGV